MNKKLIIIAVAIIAVLGIAGYLYFSKSPENPFSDAIPEAVKDIKEKIAGKPDIDSWLIYRSDKAGFSIKYPPNYEVKEEYQTIIFVPPELKDVSAQPTTLKELPLGISMPQDKTYDDIKKEIKTQTEGIGYLEEKEKVIAGVLGTELRVGPPPESEKKLHQLLNIIPYKNTALFFVTYALSKKQLENEGVPLLDAFISTFKPE